MKLKASEIIILFIAAIVGIGAYLVSQTEPKETVYSEETTELHTLEPLITDTQTLDEREFLVTNPQQAQQTVQQFFALFEKISSDEADTQTLLQTKALLSSELQTEISEDNQTMAKDISRTVGLLTPPKSVDIIRTEQNAAESVDVIIEVTTATDEKISKTVSVINEEDSWKINSFTINE